MWALVILIGLLYLHGFLGRRTLDSPAEGRTGILAPAAAQAPEPEPIAPGMEGRADAVALTADRPPRGPVSWMEAPHTRTLTPAGRQPLPLPPAHQGLEQRRIQILAEYEALRRAADADWQQLRDCVSRLAPVAEGQDCLRPANATIADRAGSNSNP